MQFGANHILRHNKLKNWSILLWRRNDEDTMEVACRGICKSSESCPLFRCPFVAFSRCGYRRLQPKRSPVSSGWLLSFGYSRAPWRDKFCKDVVAQFIWGSFWSHYNCLRLQPSYPKGGDHFFMEERAPQSWRDWLRRPPPDPSQLPLLLLAAELLQWCKKQQKCFAFFGPTREEERVAPIP